MNFEFILYVDDQQLSAVFYAEVLQLRPTLNVPGMTEFTLGENFKLGLMPNDGIAKIIAPAMPHPANGNGMPRCELYLNVDDVVAAYDRAVSAGAKEIDRAKPRDWGDTVAYVADPDGHIIAFAQKS